MGKEAEAAKFLLLVSERSRWIGDARTELAWMIGKPVSPLPVNWKTAPKS